MNGLLCLKWNNHSSAFYKTINSQRSKELHCDATIVCHGKFFPVHRLVLTVCSEYFEEIFERTKCKHPFIIVKDIQPQEIEALLNYMYKGEVNVMQDLLPGLIKAAEALQVKGLAVPDDDGDAENDDSARPIIEPSKDRKRSHNSSPPINSKRSRKNYDRKVLPLRERDSSQNGLSGSILTNQHRPIAKDISDPPSNSVPKEETVMLDNAIAKLSHNDSSNDGLNEDPTLDMNEVENPNNDVKIEPEEFVDANDDQDYLDDDQIDSENEGSLFQTLLRGNVSSSLEKIKNNAEPLAQCSSWDENLDHSNDDRPNLLDSENLLDEVINKLPLESLTDIDDDHEIYRDTFSISQKMMCPHCGYNCIDTALLKQHIQEHLLKRFECRYCDYKTDKKGNMKTHIMVHTGEKPYKCAICQYKATHRRSVINHMVKRHFKNNLNDLTSFPLHI